MNFFNEGDKNMTNLFNGMFGKIAPGMCRISIDGAIAIKTSNGYKTYDVKTNALVNCDNFAFDIGEDLFFMMPTNKVKTGDIILIGGKPRCVIEATKNEIRALCYEDGRIDTIVPEHHVFMGKQYFYGKIVSLVGNMNKKNGLGMLMKYKMMSELFKGGNNGNNNNFGGLAALAFMNGDKDMGDMFDFNFDTDDDDEEEEETKEE